MVASIATVLKSIQLDPGMNLPVKFHQNRLTPLVSRAVHYIQTNTQTYIQTDGKSENKGTLATTQHTNIQTNKHIFIHTYRQTDKPAGDNGPILK